jgi:hypothetical protein
METTAQSLIAEFMPRYSIHQIDRVPVAAEPALAYAVARRVDMQRIPFVRLLFQLRLVPDRVTAWLRREPYEADLSARIEDITRAGSGFELLGEEAGREVVVGSIGKFWQPSIEFAHVAPVEFVGFEQPGYGKLAWNIRVDPRSGGGSWVSVELRVGATDPESLVRFKRYWAVIGRFSHAIRHAVLRMLVDELGAAPPDAARPLPGDELLARPRFAKTHATTIEAPVERVWPWLVQMGARRAGWYSFDFLDNGRTPSAERIIPELQTLSVGDIIPALPNTSEGFAVLAMDAPRSLVLGDPSLLPGGARPAGAPPQKTTWAFLVEPIGTAATRLTVRARAEYALDPKMVIMAPLLGVAHEVMERRQLYNLRRRAEAASAAAA